MEEQAPLEEQEAGAARQAEDGAAPAAEDGPESRTAQLEAELATMKDRYLRTLAEMDNLRRRTEREKEENRRRANEGLISELLPVLDNLTRALEAAGQASSVEGLRDGVERIRKQFADVLERNGLQRIDAVGQPFDPNLHEAIMQVPPQEGQEPHTVVEELRAGYRLGDWVVRPTLVKVTSD